MSTVSVIWAQKVNVTDSGSQLTKTGGADATEDAGAVSQQILTLPVDLEFVVGQTNKTMNVGISNQLDNSTAVSLIDQNFWITNAGEAEARQGATWLETLGTYTTSTVLKLRVESDGTVKWYMDGVLKRTSAPGAMPAVPLVVDITIQGSGGMLSSATITLVGSTAYVELLDSTAPAFVVLAEVQPMERLASWTAAGGGLTNTWYTSFLTQVETSRVPGGLYRRLDEVRHNATALSSRTTAALVNSNLGSYFHETSTSRIYVSIDSGLNPDTAALIGAWFTLFFSTTSISFSDQPLYSARVTGSMPTISAEKPETMFGSIVSESGAVSLMNGDTLFDRLSRQWIWRNKRVTIKHGGAGFVYADFVTVTTMRINHPAVGDEVSTLELDSMGSILNRSIPPRTWGDSIGALYGDITEQAIFGLSQPLLLGAVTDCPLAAMDVSATPYPEYAVVDPDLHPLGFTVSACYAIHKTTGARTTLTAGTHYQISPNDTIEITGYATYAPETYDFRADVTSLGPRAIAPVFQAQRFGSLAVAILLAAGEDLANIDTPVFLALDTSVPQALGAYINGPIIAADLMHELEQSVNGQVYIGTDGRWTGRVFSPSLPVAATALADADFKTWEPEDDPQPVLNRVRVQYAKNPATDGATEVSSSDDTVLYGSETSDSHTVPTMLRASADAAVLAGHLRFLRGTTAARIRFEERGLKLMGALVGDLVTVTRSRAPDAMTGRYDGHVLMITQIDKSLGPDTPTVRGVLNDVEGQTARIFRLAAAGATTTWATATATERAQLGFLSDATGYLDAADPQTRYRKVLW